MVEVEEPEMSESSCSSRGGAKDAVPGFRQIEIIEVNRENFKQIWPYLLICVKSADFIGVDLELSGLGGKGLRAKDVEERYRVIKNAAQTRSILSLGITTMKLIQKSEKKKKLKYQAQVFNILTLSNEPFTIEPSALQFLAKHSFDFNRLIQSGVQFKGKDCPIRVLFQEIFATSATFCLHNGFIDLAFIYQQFYGVDLPDTLDEFCHNLTDLFPLDYLPVVDSKYLAEYHTRMSSSYLEYVFRRSQGDNEIERQNKRFYVEVVFPNSDGMMKCVKSAIERVDCALPEDFPDHPIPIDLHNHICNSFANHGFCHARNTDSCVKLHDVDYAIDLQRIKENKKAFKRKRRYSSVIAESVASENAEEEKMWKKKKLDNNLKVKDIRETIAKRLAVSGLHRAGVDAFMTTFAVVCQQRLELVRNDSISTEHANKLPLMGKEQPITLRHRQNLKVTENAENVAEESNSHEKSMEQINKQRELAKQLAHKSH